MNKREQSSDYYEKQKKQNNNTIAIDFDGVIHQNSKGFHDGTIYDNPVEKTLESLLIIKQMGYEIVIYTCKANPDRPLVDKKTGIQLIWEWLDKHNMANMIKDVVWGKPWAKVYIDDKGYRFLTWEECLKFLEKEI